MVFLGALVLAAGGIYLFLRRHRGQSALLRTTVLVGLVVALTRATLACVGWYVVEHNGGQAQIPGFVLAMLAWPEGFLLAERRTTPASPEFLFRLWLLLFVSTSAFVAVLATLARRGQYAPRP